MLLIACPHCGTRAQEEFVYERSSDAVIPAGADADAALAALYERENPRGWADEIWWHAYGCRGWMTLRRHRVSHAIAQVTPLGPDIAS